MQLSSILRNTVLISRILRNTGFKKILGALRANGSPLPEFETDEAHDYFVTRFFIHEEFYDDGVEDGVKNGVENELTNPKLTPQDIQNRIVNMVSIKPDITKKEIAKKLDMSLSGIKYHIMQLTSTGKIRYIGTSRNGHWEVPGKNE